ncbi:MAG: tetratricopeptide repeat protein, partial [Mariprofundus sp.]|nr:tetratricopeptide repeat protein [Mariprofundus sp.]
EIDGIQPGNADAAYLRGVLARDCDQCEQAESHFCKAIEAAPKRGDFVAALAGLYLSVGEYKQAVPLYRQALALDSHDINVRIGLAGALVCLSQYDEAIELLEGARKQRPGDLNIRMGLFQACHDSGRIVRAREHLNAILKRDPENAQAFYSLGLLDIENGTLAEGEKEIRQAIACEPDYTEACTVLADLQRFDHENDDALAMRQLYKRCPEGSVERMNMAFALAKVDDDLGHYDEAFANMQEANEIRRGFSRYDEAVELKRMQRLMACYSSDVVAEHSAIDDPVPIFVLGMPRSGTSLVEQILSAHPDVCSCGENHMLNESIASVSSEAANSAADPVSICAWTTTQCRVGGDAYLGRLRQVNPDAFRYTDKSLNHILHIGSIARLLPQAKIIHVRRHPLDTCLSIYKNNITGGLFDYGHDLGELGRYYRMYVKLMKHWALTLPAGMLIEIDYEKLVDDQEQQSRALLAACGLEWSPACLDFHRADNRVLTASMTQVRQPVYTRSVGVWKHYEMHLQPLADLLKR